MQTVYKQQNLKKSIAKKYWIIIALKSIANTSINTSR